MRSESVSYDVEGDDHETSKQSVSPTEDPDIVGALNQHVTSNIAMYSPFASRMDLSRDMSMPSSYWLDKYPNAALWARTTASPIESVATGCRLAPQSVSLLSTILNTCKALLGAGIVALPMLFAEASLVPGIVILVMAIVCSSISFWMIGYLSHRTGHKSWGRMWQSIMKHSKCQLPSWVKAGAPIDLLIMVQNICNGTSYTLIATANIINVYQDCLQIEPPAQPPTADPLPPSQWEIENPSAFFRRQIACMVVTAIILVPLAFFNLRKISWVSVFGILASVLLVFAVCFCDPSHQNESVAVPQAHPAKLWEPSLQSIACFAQFSIAVCAHSIAPNFYQALERKNLSRFATSTSCGYSIILLMNLTVAIVGYLRFGSVVAHQANILEAYSNNHSPFSLNACFVNIARIGVALSVLVNHSFQSRAFSTAFANIAPLSMLQHKLCLSKDDVIESKNETATNPKQACKIKVIHRASNTNAIKAPHLTEPSQQNNERSQLLIRLAYTMIVFCISLTVKRLKLLFKLVSPVISSSLVYTIPGAMVFLMGILYSPKTDTPTWKLKALTISGLVMVCLGISCTVLGLYAFFSSAQ